MPLPPGWDAEAAVAACPVITWVGPLWRFHKRTRAPLDHQGYLYASGRFNRGVPEFGEHTAWPALYLSTAPHIAVGETLRHIAPVNLADLNTQRLTRFRANLAGVLD